MDKFKSYLEQFNIAGTVTEEDIKAKFENGILVVNVPKEDVKKVEEKKYITIE